MSQHESPSGAEFLLSRDSLPTSPIATEAACVYDAIVDRIDWSEADPWLSLLQRLNGPQRALIAVAQVHEHAQYNGIRSTAEFHGEAVMRMAAQGAAEMGHHDLAEMLSEALSGDADWASLDARWDREAAFDGDAFVETHRASFFSDDRHGGEGPARR